MEDIAIVGAGLIGRSWAIVFARAGHTVRVWDHDPAVVPAAVLRIADALEGLNAFGLIDEEPAEALRNAEFRMQNADTDCFEAPQ